MEFDRNNPMGGIEIDTDIENGKVMLECRVFLCEEKEEANACLDIRIRDRENQPVFCCVHPLQQGEPVKGILLHPHMWRGTEDAYLYHVRVSLMEGTDCVTDVLETTLALRTFREIPMKGWFLNESPFQIRPVMYKIPVVDAVSNGLKKDNFADTGNLVGNVNPSKFNAREMQIRRDLGLIRDMGANTVCLEGGNVDREFAGICDEMGLIIWWQEEAKERRGVGSNWDKADVDEIPRLHGTADSLLTLRGYEPSDRYYYYKARWSRDPFVYISGSELSFQKNGNVQVTVYSNQKKVALYVDGILFEFQTGGPDFLFQEIPANRMPLMLTAEAGGCGMSATVYPFTVFSHNYHFSMTISEYNV